MNFHNNSHNNLMSQALEVIHIDSKKVSCEGGKGASGHPLVYLNMGKENSVVCPYCSKYFVLNSDSNNDKKR
ncbi:MAG: zinc-finger domain-containing protein [Rickettsiales bacterium]|nr:zinc-finger domain-containing protein [Rickettsiales bacterium]